MKKNLLFASVIAAMQLAADIKVLTFAGSTRNDSYNKKLAAEAAEIAREMGASVTTIDLRDFPLPFYDGDLEAKEGMPENGKRLRELLLQSDVILIATPEYNGSIPAVLKNLIDWLSRDGAGKPTRECFQGKKFGLMSASPGPNGGKGALAHLHFILKRLGGEVLEAHTSVASAYNLTPEQRELKIESLKGGIAQLLAARDPQKIL